MTSLNDLVSMSNALGAPALDAAILGEGNTSARCDGDTFWVKGSGCTLASMGAGDFVHLRFREILGLMGKAADEKLISSTYEAAKVDPAQKRRPSVETLFHAVLLSYPGINVVAHTHPTFVNSLTCSPGWDVNLAGRMFPDEAVVMGRDSVFVPYTDPGVPLASAIKAGVDGYIARFGEAPKVVYMQNHGLIALAASHGEAVNITAMAIKAARIRLGALTAGGIRTLPAATIDHLVARPDEKYRQAALGLTAAK
ncbi:MAG: class II aldolase/adducin family protein [Planctomycetes bacterium]|nr:class II aldolase/adducin family protein [Planctomycetota bacterium]